MRNRQPLLMGAVAYAPKVVTIWEGFKAWFAREGLEFDYVLYSNYEAQVEALLDGTVHLAWNSPLAWIRAERLARARGVRVEAIAMRDTDRDLRSVIVVRHDSAVRELGDLRGRTVGVGAIDSPQATLLPLLHLRRAGLQAGRDITVRRFDVLGGKHGDHIGGERDAALALLEGAVDACCMIDGNHLAFGLDRTLPAGSTRIIAATAPYDHCNMTVAPAAPAAEVACFTALLLAMRWDDAVVRPLLELEGLKQWLPGRVSGYADLDRAVDDEEFYGRDGDIRCPTIDTESLGLDAGGLLLVRRALAALPAGGTLRVRGRAPQWALHLAAWCRQQGHGVSCIEEGAAGVAEAIVTRGPWAEARWQQAAPARDPIAAGGDSPAPQAQPGWGLAARGALVEAGAPDFHFALSTRDQLWADAAGELYRQAAASQWDPETAIDWRAAVPPPDALEGAIVQVMTYLVENENAALVVPARHLGQVHPHYREVQQLLALQCADEARHVEVFTRRLYLHGRGPQRSTAGGQASLHTLVEAPDFSTALFLLGVLGEGTFVNLLGFLREHAPDPVTRQVCRLVARDEARHVAFAMAHLLHRLHVQPGYLQQLRIAIEQRHEALSPTAGLGEDTLDALVLIAGGGEDVAAIARGHAAVQQLQADMAAGRRSRLLHLGFAPAEAERLAELHTRNFM